MRVSTLATVALAFAFVASACKTPDASQTLADPAAALPLTLPKIETEAQFVGLSKDASGIIKSGRITKFLIDNRNPASPKIHFINLNFTVGGQIPDYAKFHFFFAKKHLQIPEEGEEFNAVTYFRDDKRYMAGSVQTYKLDGGETLTYGVQFYPQDVIHGIKTLEATQIVQNAITIPGARFAFVESGSQQTTEDVAQAYEQAGIQRLSIEKILGSVKYIPMHQGEAWGYLRIFPQSQETLSATDIPVFDDLPLDLTVVAGTLTRAFQDSNSHVNLKSKERNTPNAVLRDASPTHAQLAPWADKPVHLVIGPEGFTLEATTPEIIAAKLAVRMNKPWIPISWEVATEPLGYDAMCGTNPLDCIKQGRKYGSKAAHLGFLAHRRVLGRASVAGTFSNRVGYDLVPIGFGIPLQFYNDLVQFPANAALKTKLADLITREKAGTLTTAERNQLLGEVQTLFFNAKFPPATIAKIKAKFAQDLPGIEKVKVRSSANAEDVENFDGAGLHDSYSAKPAEVDNPDQSCIRELDEEEGGGGETKAKMKPRTVACAIKGVYASMWNKRAIEERSFARIDHGTVAMGISVLPAYDYQAKIIGNTVVVSRVVNTTDVYGYTLSVQKKNNLVTNPDPGTWSEVTIAALGVGAEPTTLTVTRFAKPKKDQPALTAPVLAKEQMLVMVDLVKAVEEAYCRYKPGYYAGDCEFVSVDVDKPKALDLEMKVLEGGRFVVKQVREFSGR